MNIEEVFMILIAHMKSGLKLHYKMMETYDFLSLKGYKKCQEYHYLSELKEQLELYHYYIEHYYKLLNIDEATDADLFPNSWYKYTIQEVDINTKRTTVKDLMKKWIKWEEETKKLYQDMYKELVAIGEIAAANYLEKYINNVSEELRQAQQKRIELDTIEYDAIEIVREQPDYEKQYEKEIKKLYKVGDSL